MTRAWLMLAPVVAMGCYRYVPETALVPVVGGVYRAHLTPAGSSSLAPLLGRDVVAFEGHVLSTTDTALTVSMSQTLLRAAPRPTIWAGEQMTIGRGTIQRFERRELDRGRSLRYAALIGAGTIVAGKLWLSIKGRASGDPNPGPGPIPP
jgi:hypothetical protein